MRTGCFLHDVMKTELVVVDEGESVYLGCELMANMKIGSLLVSKRNNIVGIITEKDIIRRVIAKGKDPKTTTFKEIDNRPVLTMDISADIYDAFVFMNDEGIRHLPVAEKGMIRGMVTLSDLLKLSPGLIEIIYQKGYEGKLNATA